MNAVTKFQDHAVTIHQDHQLTALAIRAQVNLVQEVMKAVMKEGTHYGTIPGCGDKKSLFKPGAEVLGATFRIAPSYLIEDLSALDVARYRVRCVGTHQTSGIVMGEGMGECSTGEEKYKWRKAYDEEFNATPEDRKRIKYGKYNTKQIRTEAADLANTVLKMACKRAQVAMTLNVTAASDIFTQDIEDLSEELRSIVDPETGEMVGRSSESVAGPSRKTEKKAASTEPVNTEPAKDGQKRLIRAKLEQASLSETDLIAKFNHGVDNLTMGEVNAVLSWINNPSGEK